ncbi:hypothetical protein [Thiolapillus sp.]
MPGIRRLLVLALLASFPAHQAQAFFCFRFAMGSGAATHERHSRRPVAPRGFAAAPHPSWYLRNQPPPPVYPGSYPPPVGIPLNPLPLISTPQPGM